jgi:peroxiredoxin
VELQGVTVAKLAEDELYLIRFLTKGRVAPDLAGVDSGSRPLRLSDYRGKVVVLLFWNSNVPEVVKLLENMNRITRDRAGKPVVVVGVNNDTLANLRNMQRTDPDLLDFPNFSDPGNGLSAKFRVGTWPLVYLLDGERRIQYAGPPGSLITAAIDALLAPPKPLPAARPAAPGAPPR